MADFPMPAAPRGVIRAGLLATAFGCALPQGGAEIPPDAAGLEFFESRIRPVLVEHCYQCHSADAKKVKGGLLLDSKEDLLKGGTSGAAVVPGDPETSSLIQAVRYEDKDLQMPPRKDGGRKLPDAAIDDLTRWVKIGAPYTATAGPKKVAAQPWSFEPVKDPPAPVVKDAAWPRTSIDPFVLAKIEASGLRPSPAVDARPFIRRATFDLTGLPPTPEEVATFVAAAAQSPSAYEN